MFLLLKKVRDFKAGYYREYKLKTLAQIETSWLKLYFFSKLRLPVQSRTITRYHNQRVNIVRNSLTESLVQGWKFVLFS